MIWLGIKLLIKLQKSQELHESIVQIQLQMRENVGHDKIIHKERHTSPEKRQKTIDDLKSYNQIKTLLQKSSLCN